METKPAGGRESLSSVCSFFVHRSLKNLLHNTHYFFTINPYTKTIANNKCLQDFFHNTELIISALLPFSNIKMPLTAGEAFCFVIFNFIVFSSLPSFSSLFSYFSFHSHPVLLPRPSFLPTTGLLTSLDRSKSPIRFGTAIKPLKISDRLHTRSRRATQPKKTAFA